MMMASTWDIVMYRKMMRVYRERGSEEDREGPQNYNVADLALIGFALGIGLSMVGVSSFRYHACAGKCERSGFFDVYAIYVTVCYLLFDSVLFFLCTAKCIQPGPGDKMKLLLINVFFFIGVSRMPDHLLLVYNAGGYNAFCLRCYIVLCLRRRLVRLSNSY